MEKDLINVQFTGVSTKGQATFAISTKSTEEPNKIWGKRTSKLLLHGEPKRCKLRILVIEDVYMYQEVKNLVVRLSQGHFRLKFKKKQP